MFLSVGDLPESLSQRILAGIILAGRFGRMRPGGGLAGGPRRRGRPCRRNREAHRDAVSDFRGFNPGRILKPYLSLSLSLSFSYSLTFSPPLYMRERRLPADPVPGDVPPELNDPSSNPVPPSKETPEPAASF